MSWLTLQSVGEMVGGKVYGGDVAVESVSIDSRTVERGALFVALRGEHYDGHDYIDKAYSAGAVAVMSCRKADISIPRIEVADTLAALAQFANQWRQQLQLLVIALTGSNGKTTTKNMLFSIMRRCREAIATKGNLNNHIGVPLTVLRFRPEHRCAVVEMGANHAGEIRSLCEIVKPRIGMVLNASAAHIEGFGDLDGVAAAKGEIYKALPSDGIGVLNCDDPYYEYWRQCFKGERVLKFGFSATADVTAKKVDEEQVMLRVAGDERPCRVRLAGQHNIMNAMAAACAAHAAGIDTDTIVAGLEAVEPMPGRLKMMRGVGGLSLIDDSYNANPSSLRAALDVLSQSSRCRWLALGDMSELGPESEAMHIGAALDAKSAGVERLLTVGSQTQATTNEFGKGAKHFESLDAMTRYIKSEASPDICLLVKGSRSAGMEKLVRALTENSSQVMGEV